MVEKLLESYQDLIAPKHTWGQVFSHIPLSSYNNIPKIFNRFVQDLKAQIGSNPCSITSSEVTQSSTLLSMCCFSPNISLSKAESLATDGAAMDLVRMLTENAPGLACVLKGVALAVENAREKPDFHLVQIILKHWVQRSSCFPERLEAGFLSHLLAVLQGYGDALRRLPATVYDRTIAPIVGSIVHAENWESLSSPESPLHFLAQQHMSDAITVLLGDPNVSVNATNAVGDTPLLCALTHDADMSDLSVIRTVSALVAHAQINIAHVGNQGETAISRCMSHFKSGKGINKCLRIIRMLFQLDRSLVGDAAIAYSVLLRFAIPRGEETLYVLTLHAVLQTTGCDLSLCDLDGCDLDARCAMCLSLLTDRGSDEQVVLAVLGVLASLCASASSEHALMKEAFLQLYQYSGENALPQAHLSAVLTVLEVICINVNFNINDCMNDQNETVAHLASRRKYFELLEVICKRSEFILHFDACGNSFITGLLEKCSDIERLLSLLRRVRVGVNTGVNTRQETAIFYVARNMDTSAFKRVIAEEAFSPNAVDKAGNSILMHICVKMLSDQMIEKVKCVLSKAKTDVSLTNTAGESVIHFLFNTHLYNAGCLLQGILEIIALIMDHCTANAELGCTFGRLWFRHVTEFQKNKGYIELLVNRFKRSGASPMSITIPDDSVNVNVGVNAVVAHVPHAGWPMCDILGVFYHLCHHQGVDEGSLRLILLYTTLYAVRADDSTNNMVSGIQEYIVSRPTFDVNHPLDTKGRTIAHIAAMKSQVNFLFSLCRLPQFSPLLFDDLGNTFLYYLWKSGKVVPSEIVMFIDGSASDKLSVNSQITQQSATFGHMMAEELNADGLQAVAKLPSFNPNVRDTCFMSIFDQLWENKSARQEKSFQMVACLLSLSNLEVENNKYPENSVLTRIINLLNVRTSDKTLVGKLVEMLIKHEKLSVPGLDAIFNGIVDVAGDEVNYTSILKCLIREPRFQAKNVSLKGQRLTSLKAVCLEHVETVSSAVILLKKLVNHSECDSKVLTELTLDLINLESVDTDLINHISDIIAAAFNHANYLINDHITGDGKTIMHICAQKQRMYILEQGFKMSKTDLDIKDSMGRTFLYYLCVNPKLPLSKVLPFLDEDLTKHDLINAPLDMRKTPPIFVYADKRELLEFKQISGMAKFDPNIRDEQGDTILMHLAQIGVDQITHDMFENILSLADPNVSIRNNDALACTDLLCRNLTAEGRGTAAKKHIMQIILSVIKHDSFQGKMLGKSMFVSLMSVTYSIDAISLLDSVLYHLLKHSDFTIDAIRLNTGLYPSLINACDTLMPMNKCAFDILKKICSDETIESSLLRQVFTSVLDKTANKNNGNAYGILSTIVENNNFAINSALNDNQDSAAHMCAKKSCLPMLKKLCAMEEFAADTRDANGYHFLYYLVTGDVILWKDVLDLVADSTCRNLTINSQVTLSSENIAHLYAKQGNVNAIKAICERFSNYCPNAADASGNTVLTSDQPWTDAAMGILECFLLRKETDLSVHRFNGVSLIDRCKTQYRSCESQEKAKVFDYMGLVLGHSSASAEMLHSAFEAIMKFELTVELNMKAQMVFQQILKHSNFMLPCITIPKDKLSLLKDACLSSLSSPSAETLLQSLCKTPSCDMGFLGKLFCDLTDLKTEHKMWKANTLILIIKHVNFRVNQGLNETRETAAHICASTPEMLTVLRAVCKLEGFDPHIPCSHGYTFAYRLAVSDLSFVEKLPFIDGRLSGRNIINSPVTDDGSTIGHVLTRHRNSLALRTLSKTDTYDPNAKDRTGRSAIFYLPMVPLNSPNTAESMAKTYLAHPRFNVALQDSNGKTVVTALVDQFYSAVSDAAVVLNVTSKLIQHASRTKEMINTLFSDLLRLTVPEQTENGVLDLLCILVTQNSFNVHSCTAIRNHIHRLAMVALRHMRGRKEAQTLLLDLLEVITKHENCHHNTLSMLFLSLFYEHRQDGVLPDVIERYLLRLLRNSHFNVKEPLNNKKQTVAHLCALNKDFKLLEAIFKIRTVDPKTPDVDGLTPLVYIIKCFPGDIAYKFICEKNISWEFWLTINEKKQSVLSYCKGMDNYDPMIDGAIQRAMDLRHMKIGIRAADPQPQPYYIPPRNVSLVREEMDGHIGGVIKATPEFYEATKEDIRQEKVYELHKPMKGKVCIISLPVFTNPKFRSLPGYVRDSELVAQTFTGMGFHILKPYPAEETERTLTAKEILNVVQDFAEKQEDDEQCAVLVILTHGGNGYIYGSDGEKLTIAEIVRILDNKNCPKMFGKPKLLIIHACQGEECDRGVAKLAGPPEEQPAAPTEETLLPASSDMIICHSSFPGYASFVKPSGSVYINMMMDVLKREGHHSDLLSMLTTINRLVAKETSLVEGEGVAIDNTMYKQMPRFSSSLTKKLFFFPHFQNIQNDSRLAANLNGI